MSSLLKSVPNPARQRQMGAAPLANAPPFGPVSHDAEELLHALQLRLLELEQQNQELHAANVALQPLRDRITKRRHVEEGLRHQNDLLASIIRYFPGGISVIGTDLCLLACNEQFAELLDFPPELFAKPDVGLEDFFRFNAQRGEYGPGDTEQQVAAAIERARKFEAHKFERVRPNGRALEITGIPLPLGGFVTTYVDITERKHQEEQLRIAAAAFESQEATMVTDANGMILRVNRAFTEMTGFSPDEVVGQAPRLLKSGRDGSEFFREMLEELGRNGKWQGEVWAKRKNGEEYPDWLTISAVTRDDGIVTHFVGTHYDISERKRAQERIAQLAYFDSLTLLPNRALLLDRLQQAMTFSHRSGGFGALLFIDLDNFKTLNDTQGHDRGDLLLLQVAKRLTASVREGDTVARLGGDEFVVVLGNLAVVATDAAAQAEIVTQKILAAIGSTYQLADSEWRSTASIGVTLFCGQETPIEELLKHADMAMYKAKSLGRNALCFFDPTIQTAVLARSSLEDDLRNALAAKQFVLHYQAQIGSSGEVTGCEVLVRWLHPLRGVVSPVEFIPSAEETGLILPLGSWVLETACAQLAQWATQPELAHLSVAVNVSSRQFSQPDFVAQVVEVLAQTQAPPGLLKLELTESLLASNVQDVIEKMVELKAKGVGFSLDDFGTGYSSLFYLKRLPLDQLKIDQGFVKDILSDHNDAAIATMIVALAQSMQLAVIAEGVETEVQRDFLAGLGCHAYQGYLYSRPVPVDEFERLVKQG